MLMAACSDHHYDGAECHSKKHAEHKHGDYHHSHSGKTYYNTAGKNLNVRSGAGTNHSIVGKIASGETVKVKKCNEAHTWCKTSNGWVSKRFLGKK